MASNDEFNGCLVLFLLVFIGGTALFAVGAVLMPREQAEITARADCAKKCAPHPVSPSTQRCVCDMTLEVR